MRILSADRGSYDTKFIVEMRDEELAMLVSATSYARGSDVSRIQRGDVVNIDKNHLRLRNLINERNTIKKNIDSLRALADLMEPLEDCVTVAIPEIESEQE